MATVWITEFTDIATDSSSNRKVQVAQLPVVTTQKVTYSTSTQSAAFNAATRFIRIFCDNGGTRSHFAVGSSPTATTSTTPISDAVAEFYGVNPGDKIALIGG